MQQITGAAHVITSFYVSVISVSCSADNGKLAAGFWQPVSHRSKQSMSVKKLIIIIAGRFSCSSTILGKLPSHHGEKRRTRLQKNNTAVQRPINHTVGVLGSPNADANGRCGPETGADGQNLDSGFETGVGGDLVYRSPLKISSSAGREAFSRATFPEATERPRKLENVKVAASSERRFALRPA